jgi:hypothetical protein
MTDSATRKWPLGRHLGFLTSPLFLATVAVAGVMFVGGLTLWNGRVDAEREALV